jgi:transposase
VTVFFPVPRVECLSCHRVRQVRIGFAEERRRHTRSFERYVLELSRSMTILDVARHLGVSWDLIKDIQRRYLHRRFSRPRLRDVRFLAIDEISVRKGWRYMTVVLDLESGAVVHVADTRSGKALEPFWRRLKRSRAKVQAVAIDFHRPYILAIEKHLPGTAVVFDRFHIISYFNLQLSRLRRAVQRKAEGQQKKVLKGTRWLLLKSPRHLDGNRQEAKRLEEALKLNEPLATAYYLKEDLQRFWKQKTKAEARTYLCGWLRRARASGIWALEKVADTIETHRAGLIAWYDYPISTGPLEGVNNKIKTLKRQAYGFRDPAFFKLKILALHESRLALVG